MSTSEIVSTSPSPTGSSAKALVAMIQRPSEQQPDPALLAAISKLPNADVAAVLHTWYVSGLPDVELGAWQLCPMHGGGVAPLVDALKAGRKKLPLGTGAYDDSICLRFLKKRLTITIENFDDSSVPRTFSSLQDFTDGLVRDALELLDDNDEAWPLPDWLVTFFANNGLGSGAQQALKVHVARVAATSKQHEPEATAWLAQHGPPKPDKPRVDTSHVSMTFTSCDEVEYPEPPPDIAAGLKAGGHFYYHRGSSGRWFSVTKKGIRFFNDQGKRKVANSLIHNRDHGPSLVLDDNDETALIGAGRSVVRVILASGKKETLLELPVGTAKVSATPDGQAIVSAPRDANCDTKQLDIYDLAGNKLREVPICYRFVEVVFPLWDDLMLISHFDGIAVVDVAEGVVVGVHGSSARTVRLVDDRVVCSVYGGSVELRRQQ